MGQRPFASLIRKWMRDTLKGIESSGRKRWNTISAGRNRMAYDLAEHVNHSSGEV